MQHAVRTGEEQLGTYPENDLVIKKLEMMAGYNDLTKKHTSRHECLHSNSVFDVVLIPVSVCGKFIY